MLKKAVLPLGILIAGSAIVATLILAKPKPQPMPPQAEAAHMKIAVLPVAKETQRLNVRAQGTVEPRREIDLVTQVSGQVVAVEPAFVDGGFFSSGQLLLQIDDRDYHAAVLAAEAQVAEAEQKLAEEEGMSLQARREWRDLGNTDANDLFMRKPQLAAAKARLESAKAALSMAQLNLERTRLSVPFDGRVKQISVDLGEYVSIGSVLATVYDATMVEVRLPLTEKQAALVNLPFLPQSLQDYSLPPVTIRGTVAGEAYEWQGELARTDAFVDADSRMYFAVVEVSDPFIADPAERFHQAPLLPGLFVEAEIQGKEMANVMELPRSALYERDKLVTVDAENKVAEQQVRVLHRTDSQVWVQADFPEDLKIAVEKQSLTSIGDTVEPVAFQDYGQPVASAEPVADSRLED